MDNEGTGRMILVVDDKEENRRLLKKILVRRGYAVTEAATGEAAVELARSGRPDLVLMDLRLREESTASRPHGG